MLPFGCIDSDLGYLHLERDRKKCVATLFFKILSECLCSFLVKATVFHCRTDHSRRVTGGSQLLFLSLAVSYTGSMHIIA